MGEYKDRLYSHQMGQAVSGFHIVVKHKESTAKGDGAAVKGNAVQGRGHSVLADAKVENAAGVIGCLKIATLVDKSVIRAGQIRRSAKKEGNFFGDDIKNFARSLTGC